MVLLSVAAAGEQWSLIEGARTVALCQFENETRQSDCFADHLAWKGWNRFQVEGGWHGGPKAGEGYVCLLEWVDGGWRILFYEADLGRLNLWRTLLPCRSPLSP